MKNNKGYYSWIHSLNRAGIESQKRGFKMLKENTDPKKDFTGQPDTENPGLVYDPSEHKKIDAEIQKQGEERSNNRRRTAMTSKPVTAPNPTDLNPDNYDGSDVGRGGDADEVTIGKSSDEQEFEDSDFSKQISDAAAILKDAQQNQKRRWDEEDAKEAAAKKAEEEDYEEGEEARHWGGFSGRTGEVNESITDKIKRIMNSNRS